jgi:hypothetical protein
MSDMFPNYVNINPEDDHALFLWDSDLFAPIDEDGDPSWLHLPLLQEEEFHLLLHRLPPAWLFSYPCTCCSTSHAALRAAALTNVQGGAAPAAPVAINTTQLEQTLTAPYDQLAAQFATMEAGITDGYAEVVDALEKLEEALQ